MMRPNSKTSYLLQHVCSILSKQADQTLQEKLNIGLSQFKILRVLQHSPQKQQRQIAEWLGQTEASISRQIKIMIDKSLLEVTISPKNRREHLTRPTAKGIRMTEQAFDILSTQQAEMYKAVGIAKLAQLSDTLQLMHDHICPGGKASPCHEPFQASNNHKI